MLIDVNDVNVLTVCVVTHLTMILYYFYFK